jgi:hypothetical protein
MMLGAPGATAATDVTGEALIGIPIREQFSMGAGSVTPEGLTFVVDYRYSFEWRETPVRLNVTGTMKGRLAGVRPLPSYSYPGEFIEHDDDGR